MKKVIFFLIILFTTGIAINAQEGQSKSKKEIIRDDLLTPMNRVKTSEYFELSSIRQGKAFRILVLGNSIARHGKAESIGWLPHEGGMAATEEDKDYVHLLFRKVEALIPNKKIILRVASIVKFERGFSTFDFTKLRTFVEYQPDLIIFQLGENTSLKEADAPGVFQEKYVELINCFKNDRNPVIICTTPFFADLKKNEVIEQVALATHSYVADLSHLTLLDSQNYAKDEINYSGNKSEWKVAGIGIHPGDYGMKNIAQQLFIVINAINSKSNF